MKKSKVVLTLVAATLCSCAGITSTQVEATATDALNAAGVIVQAYVGLKTPVPASALQTGNSSVNKYLAATTTILSAPPTQALVNDIFALAKQAPATVPAP